MSHNLPWQNDNEKRADYELLLQQIQAIVSDERNAIANMANASALLNGFLPNTIFAGFYLFNGEQLVLGPFQGGVSCVRIDLGRGVCGTAAQTHTTMVIDDVHQIENHIVCDSRAQSEIVVPMMKDTQLLGVLDIDADFTCAYDAIDQAYLEQFVRILIQHSDF